MRRFSLFAMVFVLAASIAVAIIGRSWANDPQPVTKSGSEGPGVGSGNTGATSAPAATSAPRRRQFSRRRLRPSRRFRRRSRQSMVV